MVKNDFETHGYTVSCPGCLWIQNQIGMKRGHSETCRQRMEVALKDDEPGQERLRRQKERTDHWLAEQVGQAAEILQDGPAATPDVVTHPEPINIDTDIVATETSTDWNFQPEPDTDAMVTTEEQSPYEMPNWDQIPQTPQTTIMVNGEQIPQTPDDTMMMFDSNVQLQDAAASSKDLRYGTPERNPPVVRRADDRSPTVSPQDRSRMKVARDGHD